ncbi:10024_t:CDS:2, partial [Dentiscutata erythropus]
MWVLLEGHLSPLKLKADLSQVSDLGDFKDVLKEKIPVLKNVEPYDILFLNYEDRTTPIRPGASLQLFVNSTTNMNLLVVRYQISDSSRKKAFGDWNLKEVGTEIYKSTFDSIDSVPQLSLEEFPELNPSFSEEEIEFFIKQLKDKAFALNNKFSTNKATVRQYISIFMTMAVQHIRKYRDPTTELNVESELDGSRGYGNLDYEVVIQDVPVLINEAKNQDMDKGVAQNLVQVYTAAEKLLRKRKRDEQVNSLPPMLF